jgi:hypothetical protein
MIGAEDYGFQLERGELTGKDNYQGYFRLKNKIRPRSLAKELNSDFAGIEVMAAVNWTALKAYCVKEETRIKGPWFISNQVKKYSDLVPLLEDPHPSRRGQTSLLEIMKTPGKNIERSIYWIYDPYGNTGKSIFSKYLAVVLNALVLGWAYAADLKHAVASCEDEPSIIIFDLTRTQPSRYDVSGIY